MNHLVFALRDKKADIFGLPVYSANLGSLLRDIVDLVGSGQGTVAKHPEDFALYKLAEFDDVKGVFTLLPLPDFVLEVASLLSPVSPSVVQSA